MNSMVYPLLASVPDSKQQLCITWLFLPGFWQVGHTRVRAHEDITGVQ